MEVRKRGWHLDSDNKIYLLALVNRMNSQRLSANYNDYINDKRFIDNELLNNKISALLKE